jgi:hypothetical protein
MNIYKVRTKKSFITFGSGVHLPRMPANIRLVREKDKLSNLFNPFVSYEYKFWPMRLKARVFVLGKPFQA